MLQAQTISPAPPADIGLDQQALYQLGLAHVRRLSRRIWTDHNVHDPGITTLELLCYALTDLAYRASFPVEDLLVSSGGPDAIANQMASARQILPSRPLTLLDYRKLLIDLPGVRNAWVLPVDTQLYLDPDTGALSTTPLPIPNGGRLVHVRGLYRALVDFTADVGGDAAAEGAVLAAVQQRLQANRNLCEDFLPPGAVPTQAFAVCADIELAPDADVAGVHAQVALAVDAYFDPPVRNYSLGEVLALTKPDGSAYTADEIFDGPSLDCGFILDDQLAAAELRTDIRLSDLIQAIMGIDGVRAVRDMVVTATPGVPTPADAKWLVAVAAGHRPVLDNANSRLVTFKRGLPMVPTTADVAAAIKALTDGAAAKNQVPLSGADADLPLPLGRARDISQYQSFQNHFPAVYGLGEEGLPSGSTDARVAQARQLKAYLLFFDQVMADYCQQLFHLGELFSTDPSVQATYFSRVVDSFAEWERVYARVDGTPAPSTTVDVAQLLGELDVPNVSGAAVDLDRRNRFLDHLIARFAERFHDYVALTSASLGATPADAIAVKCAFLQSYPTISADRGRAYDQTQPVAQIWDSGNVSGLEQRIAKLLGMPDAVRHDLGAGTLDAEGMFLIENILLRMDGFGDPFLPVCADPNCVDCAGQDPYSYRIQIILPAFAGRFTDMTFRRFAAEVIRQETPAHIFPKICWLDRPTMQSVEAAYHAWLLSASGPPAARAAALTELRHQLYDVAKSVYPPGFLGECAPGDDSPKVILGQTRLGSLDEETE